jgi:hypothetical protein
MAFKVFVSYSTRDITRTAQIKQMLEAVGARVFVAEYSVAAGADLSNSIITAIKNSDLFVLLWSHHAKNSEWVPQEIGVAKGCNKPVIPVVLHSGVEIPGFLKGIKYLPLYKNPKQALAWLQKNVAVKVADTSQKEALTWLGLSGAFLWLISQSKQ